MKRKQCGFFGKIFPLWIHHHEPSMWKWKFCLGPLLAMSYSESIPRRLFSCLFFNFPYLQEFLSISFTCENFFSWIFFFFFFFFSCLLFRFVFYAAAWWLQLFMNYRVHGHELITIYPMKFRSVQEHKRGRKFSDKLNYVPFGEEQQSWPEWRHHFHTNHQQHINPDPQSNCNEATQLV